MRFINVILLLLLLLLFIYFDMKRCPIATKIAALCLNDFFTCLCA